MIDLKPDAPFFVISKGIGALVMQCDLRVHLFGPGFIGCEDDDPTTLDEVRDRCEDLLCSRPVVTKVVDGRERYSCYFETLPKNARLQWLVLTANDVPVLCRPMDQLTTLGETLLIEWQGPILNIHGELYGVEVVGES